MKEKEKNKTSNKSHQKKSKSKKYNNPYEEYSVKLSKAYKKTTRIPIIILCLLTIVLSVVISLYTINTKAIDICKIYSDKVKVALNQNKDFISNVSYGLSSGAITKKTELQAYLDEMSNVNDCLSLYYYNYNENITIKSGYLKPDSSFFDTENDWYCLAYENPNDVIISDVLYDRKTKKTYITFSRAILENDHVIAVVGLNYEINELSTYITESYENGSYTILFDNSNNILLKPTGVSDITINNPSKYTIIFDGGISLGLYKDLNYAGLKILSVTSLLVPIIFTTAIIILYVILYILCIYLSAKKYNQKTKKWFAPFESINNKIYEIGKGNFDITFDEESPSFEMYTLTTSLNDTVVSLREYIEKISQTVASISDKDLSASLDSNADGNYTKISYALNNLTTSLNDSLNLIDLKAETIGKCASELERNSSIIASNSVIQNKSVANLSRNIEDLESQTQNISENAEAIRLTAKATGMHLLTSNNDMQSLIVAMESVAECYNSISELITKISDFADKTSILSLNASIEATRAGIIGKDFVLVAAEINQLATECNNSVNKIELLMSEANTSVSRGKYLVEATANTFTKSVDDSSKSVVEIDKMLAVIEEQMTAIVHINNSLKDLSKSIESNASNAEENATLSDELTTCSQSLKNAALEYTMK